MKILTKIFSLWLIALTLLGSCKQSVLKERIRTHTGLVGTNWLHEPLQAIDRLDLLHQIFGEVTTTHEVVKELYATTKLERLMGLKPLPKWLKVTFTDSTKMQNLRNTYTLGLGELSCLSLSLGTTHTLLLDDLKATKIAWQLGIKTKSTLHVLSQAKAIGIISAVKPEILKLEQIGQIAQPDLVEAILWSVGERL